MSNMRITSIEALGRTRDAVKRHIFELRKKWNA